MIEIKNQHRHVAKQLKRHCATYKQYPAIDDAACPHHAQRCAGQLRGRRPPAWAPRKYPSAREGSGLLQASGRLRNSITQNSTATEAVVGTNVEYAAIHNFGGQTAPHTILPKNGKALKFGGRFAKRVNHPGSKIPARPFMVLQPDDEQALVDAVNDYLDAALGN